MPWKRLPRKFLVCCKPDYNNEGIFGTNSVWIKNQKSENPKTELRKGKTVQVLHFVVDK
jgi:hypothetical protein